MTFLQILILTAIFLAASIISVISGSTSLITVPVMLAFGIEPHVAIATNMLGLTVMSFGATLPFVGKGIIDTQRLPLLITLTLISSVLGALLVLIVPSRSMPLIISIAMIAVAIFSSLKKEAGLVPAEGKPPRMAELLGYVATFILGIYGGFFSGGYVTLLTAAYVLLFRMTFIQAIATTKLINIVSSLIATVIFAHQGIIDYGLGLVLSFAMFVGGVIGGQLSLQLSNLWLQRIYLTVIAILTVITLRNAQQRNQSMHPPHWVTPWV
ncbi:sulfite exporter TauE/SafE family protein [Alkalinema sp. FACHB-956]|uniref:sulfite exporter TauE/SafE family protein n=1 Tax=Alkalinema sp. FACHB-956 TaxID=2692768 RepID=UPI001684BCE7|nr:sulfite exporter TauE/SafE family protein [Alkalinema sp. FACHB-956]MBD2330053.1 sulfite exporter TauE/SafE family protein [Alkalinema sp. FACHB-956]